MGPAKRPISGLLSADYPMISRRSSGASPASRQGHSRPTARDPAATRCRSGRVSPGNRPISTRYATHTFCSALIGQHPMIRHDPWSSRVGPDSNTSGRPAEGAQPLGVEARLGPARARVQPRRPAPSPRVPRSRAGLVLCDLDATCGAPTGGVRPLLPPPGPRLRAGARGGVCASSCANGRHWQRSVCASGGKPRDVFLLLLQKLHIEVAVIFEPALVGLRTQGADEP